MKKGETGEGVISYVDFPDKGIILLSELKDRRLDTGLGNEEMISTRLV